MEGRREIKKDPEQREVNEEISGTNDKQKEE